MKWLLFCAALAVSLCTHAEYLWWTVNSSDDNGISDVIAYMGDLGLDADQVEAHIVAKNGDKKDFLGGVTLDVDDNGTIYSGVQSVSLGSLTGASYSYYIELVNYTTRAVVGYSAAVSYSDLSGSIVTDSLTAIPTAQVWHGSSFKAAPEPTSSLLVLIGLSGLALRRKVKDLA